MTYSIALNYPDMPFAQTVGYSEEATLIKNETKSLAETILSSVSLGERNREIVRRCVSIFYSTREQGWDGYDALPVKFRTYINSLIFLSLLPEYLPLPELSADPDGAISMEWYRTPEWIFSISIDENGKIDYAGLFADKKISVSSYFVSEVDNDIIEYIKRV
jgi:hypothetical protein